MKKVDNKKKKKQKLDEIVIPGRLREIEWLDAADDNVGIEEIKRKKASDFCVKRKTPGRIIKEDETGIIIIRDMDENGDCEITAIPKAWVNK